MTEETIVRQNLMDDVNYRPYCGNTHPSHSPLGCNNPRAERIPDLQFKCPNCGWTSSFPEEFITRYKLKHNL